jgi:hypothetical protein
VYNNTQNIPNDVVNAINGAPSSFSVTASDKEVFEKDFNLFFTDNINEPKKLCVNACLFASAIKSDDILVSEGINEEYAALDVNGNGIIDEEDLAVFLQLQQTVITEVPMPPQIVTIENTGSPYFGNTYYVEDISKFDLDGDGSIGVTDNGIFLLDVYGQQVQEAEIISSTEGVFLSGEGGYFSIPTDLQSIDPLYTENEIAKFCHACKPTPLKRPTFQFLEDTSSRANNFIESEGFKFAYQIIYIDGSESAISPKSEIAIPPSLLYQGNNKQPDHKNYNVCRVSINSDVIGSVRWDFINKIRILAQEGDEAYKIVKEVKKEDNPTVSVTFDFKNDVIGIPISDAEENKFYDSVPQKAEAQAVVDNRLLYGNYVEGYPNHPIQATLTVQYQDRPAENFGAPLSVDSTIIKNRSDLGNFDAQLADAPVSEKMSGFRLTIDDGDFPLLEVGNYIELRMSFLPQKNFHVYTSENSYHQSTAWGINADNNDSLEVNGYQSDEEAGVNNFFIASDQEPITTDELQMSGSVVPDLSRMFSINGNNDGVASAIINPVDSYGPLPGPKEVKFGTSAANPFIIPSGRIEFSIRLRCKAAGTADDLRASFFQVLDSALGQATGLDIVSNNQSHFTVVDRSRVYKHSWDMGLSNFQKFYETDGMAKTISLGVGGSDSVGGSEGFGHYVSVLPNKGDAYFALGRTSTTAGLESEQNASGFDVNKSREFKIYLDCVPEQTLELWTCVRKWTPESPWWALSPTFLESASSDASLMNAFYNQSSYTLPSWAIGNMTVPEDQEPENIIFEGVPNVYWRLGAADAGGDPIYAEADSTTFENNDGEPAPLGRALFDQFDDVSDFCFPGTISNFEDDVYSFGHLEFPARSQFFISRVSPISNSELNSGSKYFIAAPQAQNLNFPTLSPVYNNFGKYFTVLDGEGGPGGSQAPHELEQGFQHLSTSPGGKNPIYVGLNSASSAFGHATRGYRNFSNLFATPVFFGPFFTGKIFTTHTIELYTPTSGDTFVWRDWDYNYLNENDNLNSAVVEYDKETGDRTGVRSMLPYVQGKYNGLISSNKIYVFWASGQWYSDAQDPEWDGNVKLPFSIGLRQSFIDKFGAPGFDVTNSVGEDINQSASLRSFKSNSDHDFGIVFYDIHGRRSFVNPIGSVYVGGFSDAERNGEGKGQSRVKVDLAGNAPEWAKKYQFVYGGNKSSGDFIQYTTNNAFAANTDIASTEIDLNAGKIYVSLNTLQGSSISYADEFGAKGLDGSKSVYKYSPGDKLRIISYGPQDERVYPEDYVFNVVDLVTFDPASGAENNPLTPQTAQVGAEYYGNFLVLSNNTNAEGFNYSSLLGGGTSYWNQNVVFEVFSPKKYVPSDTQVYQEIGGIYEINHSSGFNPTYSQTSVVLYEGDVYFRPTACNVNLDNYDDLFAVDTTGEDGTDSLSSNFQNVILESNRASDLTLSEIKNFGRRNVESSNARTVRREAGIIYSEKSNPESDIFNYSSFNASIFPFKDLEERFGNINFMDELGGNLFVIQQDRCTLVPVAATMLSNASGQDQLIASNEVLGKERVFSVKAGCDNNPESVVRVDTTYYFAHKSLGKIFRFVDGQGIEEISDVSMGAYFRSKFKEAIGYSGLANKKDIRIVGGYDPVKEEYLITILRPLTLEVASSDDTVIVYGCQDPTATNYNPNATNTDGSCIYEDEDSGQFACADDNLPDIVDFGPVNLGATIQGSGDGSPLTITNTGTKNLIVGNIYVQNDPQNIFSVTLDSYDIAPGEVGNIFVTANCNVVGSFTATVVIEYLNSNCQQQSTIPLSIDILDEIVEDPTGVVTINFYIGGTLIDQQYAQTSNGVWDVTIDQNRVIQAVSNSYSGDGTKALLEIEVIFDQTLGVQILPQDQITITGNIINGLDGFEFLPL